MRGEGRGGKRGRGGVSEGEIIAKRSGGLRRGKRKREGRLEEGSRR